MLTRLVYILTAIALSIPLVSGCEGDCIVGITNAFLGNYTRPISNTFSRMNRELNSMVQERCGPPVRQKDFPNYLVATYQEYQNKGYATLKRDIFPRYFHGKCQQADGTEPAGCPNPDCPVICGTPGSLVHFYPKLVSIVFESEQKLLQHSFQSSFGDIQRAVLNDASRRRKQNHRSQERCSPNALRQPLREKLNRPPVILQEECGGPTLNKCSFELSMKTYILTFP